MGRKAVGKCFESGKRPGILAAEFLPGDRFRLAQNGSDTLTGKRTTLGKSLGVTAVTIILGVMTQTGPDGVEPNNLESDSFIFQVSILDVCNCVA
jgi:hypothetical protein